MQLQAQQVEASRQLSAIRAQLNVREREKKLTTLTLREIEQLPRDPSQTQVYRGVGRMSVDSLAIHRLFRLTDSLDGIQVRARVEEQYRKHAAGKDEGVDRGGVGPREEGKGASKLSVPYGHQVADVLIAPVAQYLEGEITTAQKCVQLPSSGPPFALADAPVLLPHSLTPFLSHSSLRDILQEQAARR